MSGSPKVPSRSFRAFASCRCLPQLQCGSVLSLSDSYVVAVCAAAELEEVEPADEAGAALAARWKGLLAHVQALRPLERFRVASVGYRRHLPRRLSA